MKYFGFDPLLYFKNEVVEISVNLVDEFIVCRTPFKLTLCHGNHTDIGYYTSRIKAEIAFYKLVRKYSPDGTL